MNKASKIILGIDPGTVIMGYAVLSVKGSEIKLLHMDVLKLVAQKDTYQKLEIIFSKVSELIKTYTPNMFAIEAPFYGKNVQSMLKLGRAQGVAIAAAMQAALPVTEYSPKKVKQSITGNGNSTKEQVFKMLQHIIKLEETPHFFDATDALAVALCHHYASGTVASASNKSFKGWKEFIANNPARLINNPRLPDGQE
ncbi:crossover junction endodeoxyribonuclease RuvC [Parafilimonas sp.]|uniref:crossover junction endodeoxyribonuclease RuvC n=1 Tax=Parafilimonas sp. TaxID=1969739 RepID=UPI0039E58B45